METVPELDCYPGTASRVDSQVEREWEDSLRRRPSQEIVKRAQTLERQLSGETAFKPEDMSFAQKRRYLAAFFSGKRDDEAIAEALEDAPRPNPQ